MDIDKILDAGNDICNAVSDAVKNNNFSNLDNKIKESTSTIANEIKGTNVQNRDKVKSSSGINRQANSYQQKNSNHSTGSNKYRATLKMPRTYNTPFFRRRISPNHGLAGMISSIIGLFIFFPAGLGSFGIGQLASVPFLTINAFIFSLISIGMGFWFFRSKDSRTLARLYNYYGKLIGNREYISFDQLSDLSGQRTELVKSNIKKMIKKKFLPQAYIDKEDKILILTTEVYKQYLNAVEKRQQLIDENQRKVDSLKASDLPDSTKNLLLKGEEYLNYIKKQKTLIHSSIMVKKIFDLEEIIEKIFKRVKNHPENTDNLNTFMNYYLPTTQKLLSAYIEVSGHEDEEGANIKKTKLEIENVMDTINDAFENLFDNMFENTAMDISTDISVMKTMLAQDGLTEDSRMNKEI